MSCCSFSNLLAKQSSNNPCFVVAIRDAKKREIILVGVLFHEYCVNLKHRDAKFTAFIFPEKFGRTWPPPLPNVNTLTVIIDSEKVQKFVT
ncbi:hypothetical protein ACE6H2_027311 [Prunus campanulata]